MEDVSLQDVFMDKGPRTLQLKLQKSSYCPYTLQLFFTTATIFTTVLYMENDFYIMSIVGLEGLLKSRMLKHSF